MGTRLYVGNLSYKTSSADLKQLFTPFGTIVSAEIVSDRDTGQSKGFGFVEMSTAEEAQAAISALNGTQHQGRSISVNEARPRAERPRGSYGGGGGGGGRGGYGGGRERRGDH